MKKRSFSLLKRIGAAVLGAAMCVALLPVGAMADTSYPSSPANPATIPVTQAASSGTFTYTLTAEDESAPMPEGTEDGTYTFSLTGDSSTNIVINSDKPGTWYYTLVVEKKDGYTYDTTKYRLGVQYYNADGTLKANINALADGASADRKAAKVDFKMTVKSSGGSKSKSGSSGGHSRVSSVKTGDYAQIGLYFGVLCAAAGVMVILIVARRKRNRAE